MGQRIAVTCALLACFLCAATEGAQPGDRYLNLEARVLDRIFPINVGTTPYSSKMILRFGDSSTQLVILNYSGGRSELIRYSLAGIRSGGLRELISEKWSEDPKVTDAEIAAGLKLEVSRMPIDPEALRNVLDELKVIRISPILDNRISVGEFSEYEFWYDTWQEAVHYTITSPGGDAAQVKLRHWMDKFRRTVENLSKAK